MKLSIILTSVFLFIAPPAIAVDKSGKYIYGGGVGGHSCPFFASIMDKANEHGIGSHEYALQTAAHMNYILGFQTGYNIQTKDTCDIFDGYDMNQLLAWSHNYCKENPLKKFSSSVVLLSLTLHSKRSKTCQ